ncbi:unnamed protein product [Diatraea saccharalis]|uniref:RING-type domain-containing protein n=1 Tax=Diatraea saccharalis TaxID=40085 RepID=A0A9N9WAD9_9NEOP|nr:unnamed protein product [Diatraea saccharalis]
MISLVAKILNLFALLIQKSLLLASFVGKLIVASVAGVSNAVYSIFEYVILFLEIVYEDNIRIFTEEIPHFVNDILVIITNHLQSLYKGILLLYSDSTLGLGIVISSFKTVINAAVHVLCNVIILIKGAFVLSGNTIWLILTFLPIHLPEILQASAKFVGNIIFDIVVDAYLALLKFTNFLTDVPLQSLVGIAAAIILGRLCIHFRVTIVTWLTETYWLSVRKILYLYYAVYNYIMDSEVRVITHMANGQDISEQEVNLIANEVDDGSNADTLCIICQERQKCVLTLPCRHVCLCAECCRRLYRYQRTCPICRTFIYHSVTVYL